MAYNVPEAAQPIYISCYFVPPKHFVDYISLWTYANLFICLVFVFIYLNRTQTKTTVSFCRLSDRNGFGKIETFSVFFFNNVQFFCWYLSSSDTNSTDSPGPGSVDGYVLFQNQLI